MGKTYRRQAYKPWRKESKENRKRTNIEFRRQEKRAIDRVLRGEQDPDELVIEREPHTEGRETW